MIPSPSLRLTERRSPISADLREEWRERGHLTDERIGWLLEDRARAFPERIAVITNTETVTYAELQSRASAIARTLVTSGVGHGDVVCWMLPTDADAVATASAIWRIGAISSPIVPIYGIREMTSVLEQVRPAAVVTLSEYRGRSLPDEFEAALESAVHQPRAKLLMRGDAPGWAAGRQEGPGSLPDDVTPAPPEEPALILFTSGTEAAPKGALHSGEGLVHEARSCITDWGVTFRDTMFMGSPMTHITGLLQGYLIPTRAGATALLMDRWNPGEAIKLIERWGATYMAGATPFLRELLAAYREAGIARSSLVQYCCGGASVPPELIRDAADFGISAYRAWGMTEMPTATISNESDPLDARSETDGRVSVGVEVRVVDENSNNAPVPTGETGSLQLRGPEMMIGYVNENLDGHVFTTDGWLRTGDVGSLDTRGYLRVSGRTKDIINRGGEKFSVQEIEQLVSSHPAVRSAAVIAVPAGRLGEQIGVALVCSTPVSVEDLGEFVLAQGAAKQKRPERVVVVEQLPMNTTGKVDRRALLALFSDD